MLNGISNKMDENEDEDIEEENEVVGDVIITK
jgi:hypothetical protein